MKTLLPPKNDLAVALLVAAWIEFGRDAQHPVSADYPKDDAPLWSKWCALAADALDANGTRLHGPAGDEPVGGRHPMKEIDELMRLAETLKKAVDTSLATAAVAVELAMLTVDECARLRAELKRQQQDRAAVGAFGFNPLGVRR
jgi:hypothetical protein